MGAVKILSIWLLEKLGTKSEGKLVKVVKILWGIWFARNRKIWEEKVVTPEIAMDISMKMVTEWAAAQTKMQVTGKRGKPEADSNKENWMV